MLFVAFRAVAAAFAGCLIICAVQVWADEAETAVVAQRRPPASAAAFRPDPKAVVRHGKAYRYPQSGWIVLHIEGAPYERGEQHGYLLAAEIVDFIKARATARSPKASKEAWRDLRMLVNALFLRRYDPELLEEMKGIADGAAAAGATFDGRPIDLIDIVTLNSDLEIHCLAPGLAAAATGLEERRFAEPISTERPINPEERCSAFAATAPATADGDIVFGHITMCGLDSAHDFNVWLDIKPAAGHRVVMQSYPGGIMSAVDYYMNDAGLLVLETTISQTDFDPTGLALPSRIRRTVQYADNIDKAIETLTTSNNGLYSNEWMFADTKTGEIAMLELGTHTQKLWRSTKQEWPASTVGFYWGCNNAKDLTVRAEALPSLGGKPGNLVLRPADRDRAWLRLFDRHRGKIGEDFGFEAFTTAPLVAFPSCDAKFTTTRLARDLKSWALFGPPLGRAWTPTESDRENYPGIEALVSNDWALIGVDAVGNVSAGAVARADAAAFPEEEKEDRFEHPVSLAPAWRGTLLPQTDADTWLASGFAAYERVVALENALRKKAAGKELDRRARDHLEVALFERRSQWLVAVARLGRDIPLVDTHFDWRDTDWYHIAAGKGVMLLAALRSEVGAEKFDKLMDDFGTAHAGEKVSTAEFVAAAEQAAGHSLEAFFKPWLTGSDSAARAGDGFWAIDSFEDEPENALIVYGAQGDITAQQQAAELLARKIARRWSNIAIAAKSEEQVTDADLKDHHLLLIGRPATNALTARVVDKLPVTFGRDSFVLRGETYADPRSAVIAAAANPHNPRFSIVVYAGLSATATYRAVQALPDEDPYTAQVMLLPARQHPRRLCVTPATGVARQEKGPAAGNAGVAPE